MIILGIDPGLATLGYGVLEKDKNGNARAVDYGVVLTPKQERLPTRLAILEEGVNKVLDKFSPDEVAVEELFFSKNITTGIAVAHARGVALLACIKKCGRLFEYTPMQIKQALTGYGGADKKTDTAGNGESFAAQRHTPPRRRGGRFGGGAVPRAHLPPFGAVFNIEGQWFTRFSCKGTAKRREI